MKKLRVMLAGGEPLSRSLLKSSLASWGCDVITAQDEKQACTALNTGNIDVCILNWNDSGAYALRLCQWIRGAYLKADPHVIVLIDANSAPAIQAAYQAGANDFLTKPLRVEDVRERILAIANKISLINSLHWELGRLDPLECYRMDLASHTKARHSL
jgi:DNA-binding response OmpR family regulator